MKTFLRRILAWLLLALSIPVPAARAQFGPPVTRYGSFREIPITRISPQGWLREFLQRQVTGLTGHRQILSYPFDTCMWAGEIPRKGKYGQDWWRYEQTAYLTDGLLRLGYLVNNPTLIGEGRAGVRYLLDHPMANGRLGHPFFESQWPMAVFFRVMQAEYSATGSAALLAALNTHFESYSVDEMALGHRHVVNVEGMLWTYGLTGNGQLLQKAEEAYLRGEGNLTLANCLSPNLISIHGVSYMEEAKLPAILYSYTGKALYREAAINAFRKLDRDHMLADGVPSSNEWLGGVDPLVSHETCVISDYTWSLGYLLMATGDAAWADRIERAVFNAGPGAVSKDFKNLQYFSSVNQVIATGSSDPNRGSVRDAFGKTWMAYWPCHETECCAGNVHRFMPNYAARMWMCDREGGLVSALFGPSRVVFQDERTGESVTVIQETGYPFAETIRYRFEMARPVTFSFTFRIPGWCDEATAQLNGIALGENPGAGKFTSLRRTFRDGDIVELRLPMKAKRVQYREGVGIERGPIVFSFPVPERVTTDLGTYANLNGKHSSDPANFPALDLQPAGAWNYALAVARDEDMQVVIPAASGYPFDPGSVPVRIRVPARKVRHWELVDNRFTPPLPAPENCDYEAAIETIELVPYGSTRLRLTVFPDAGKTSPAKPDRS